MFDLEGMPPHLDELDKIYLWGAQVFGENPSEFKVALSGFGADGDREGWIGFLENAKQIFETYGDIPWVHWAPYEQTYLRRYVERFGDPEGIASRVAAKSSGLADRNEGIGRPAFAEFQPQGRRGLRWVRAQRSRIRRGMGNGDVHRGNGNQRRGKAEGIDGQNRRLQQGRPRSDVGGVPVVEGQG